MASIQDLPEELLAMILNHLERPKTQLCNRGRPTRAIIDHVAVAAVRATNRRFARLADPLMRCIVTEQCSLRPTRPSELAKWAGKVARHPDRVRFIKEIHLTRWPPSDTASKDFEAPSPEQYAALVRPVGLPVVWEAELLRGLALKSDFAHLALLLLACPELEVFTGCSTFNDFGPLLQAVFAQFHAPTAPLAEGLWSRVRQIEIGSEWGITTPDEVLPLLKLPRLRQLTVRRLGGTSTRASIPEHPPRNRCPVDLVFEDCFLSGADLRPILTACKPRSLHVRWLSIQSESFTRSNGAGRCAKQLVPVPLDEQQVTTDAIEAVHEHAPMLEHLYLDTTDLSPSDSAEAPSIGSFVELIRLRTLCLPLAALTIDSLRFPASLSSFGVLERLSGEPLNQSMLDCLSTIATQCPKTIQLVTIAARRSVDGPKNADGLATVYSAPKEILHWAVGGELTRSE